MAKDVWNKRYHVDEARLRQMVEVQGLSQAQCALALGASKGSIAGLIDRWGLRPIRLAGDSWSSRGLVPQLDAPQAVSPAMERLAQFDPVVRRAMQVRLGLPVDLSAEA